jgi:hypothetical protein
MEVVGPATDDEMILAFLRAEVHSQRFKEAARSSLGHDLSLVYEPRLDDVAQNLARKNALSAYMGYGRDEWLFAAFPSDVEWQHVLVSHEELGGLRYARCDPWFAMSGGTLKVSLGAANVANFPEINHNVAAIMKELANGRSYPELILAAESLDAPHILVEGHSRATAYYLSIHTPRQVPAIAGYSSLLSSWRFY